VIKNHEAPYHDFLSMHLILPPFWFQLKHVIKVTASDKKTRNKTYAANGCRSENGNILETERGSTRSLYGELLWKRLGTCWTLLLLLWGGQIGKK
jgi:hypothetical protein